MRGLPDQLSFEIAGRRACVVHGAFAENNRFIFASTPEMVKDEEMTAAGAEIIIAGHCGIPFTEKRGRKIWFNPGVIGMPANDGTPDGWYSVICAEGPDIIFGIRRLSYDAASSARTLREAGYAPAYADALLSGLWPSLEVLPDAERACAGVPIAETSVTLAIS